MLESSFDKVYTKFKMNFYRNLFRKVNERSGSLSATEAFSVEVIHGMHHPTIKEFAEFLKISQPNATYKVNSLIEKGYVVKINSETDKREYHLDVTPKFVDYYTVNDPYTRQVMQNIRLRFTLEEISQFERMLHVISGELMDGPVQGMADSFETRIHCKKDGQTMAVRIITDSTSDISQELAKKLDVTVIPMRVTFGGQEYRDGVDLMPNEFYQKLAESDELPTTSQLSPVELKHYFDQVASAGDSAVVILLSGELSGTVQNAMLTAKDYPDIYVVDGKNATIGLRLLVEVALSLREQGKQAGEIAEGVKEARSRERLHAVVDTLEYLKKGGRISKTAALAGTLLGIKPIIGVVEGRVEVLGKTRGLQKAFGEIFEMIEQEGGIDETMPYAIGYSGTQENMELFRPSVLERFGGQPSEGMIGSTIGTHVGPGACAVAYFAKK